MTMYGTKGKKYVVERFEELPSTNDYAKSKRGEKNNLIITAKRQSGGRGTKGRAFVSDEGGVYVSRLTFYEDFSAREAFKLMAGAAVAVCKTLENYGLRPVIKWANDIHVNGKKICGILIENVFSGNKISSSVVGIGLNVYNELPEELLKIATSIYGQTGKRVPVDEVTDRLCEALTKEYGMEEYRAYLGYMGKEVALILGDERVHGTLLSVDDEGGLLALIDGKERRLTSAEVSLRIDDEVCTDE